VFASGYESYRCFGLRRLVLLPFLPLSRSRGVRGGYILRSVVLSTKVCGPFFFPPLRRDRFVTSLFLPPVAKGGFPLSYDIFPFRSSRLLFKSAVVSYGPSRKSSLSRSCALPCDAPLRRSPVRFLSTSCLLLQRVVPGSHWNPEVAESEVLDLCLFLPPFSLKSLPLLRRDFMETVFPPLGSWRTSYDLRCNC